MGSVFLKSLCKIELKGQSGITLIEVLLVVFLMLLIFIPAYNAFKVAHESWSYTDQNNPKTIEANTALNILSQDLREATKPSIDNEPVLINSSGQGMTIYKYNTKATKWEKVIYRITDNTLYKIILSDLDPAKIITTSTPGNHHPNWEVILSGITSIESFSCEARTVNINFEISDMQTKPRFQPFLVSSTYLVRSREVGSIHGEAVPDISNPPVVNVSYLQLDKTRLTIYVNRNPKTAVLSATVWPANASDQDITWRSSNSSIAKVDDAGMVTAVSAGTGWFGTNVTITATCGGKTASCSVTVK